MLFTKANPGNWKVSFKILWPYKSQLRVGSCVFFCDAHIFGIQKSLPAIRGPTIWSHRKLLGSRNKDIVSQCFQLLPSTSPWKTRVRHVCNIFFLFVNDSSQTCFNFYLHITINRDTNNELLLEFFACNNSLGKVVDFVHW